MPMNALVEELLTISDELIQARRHVEHRHFYDRNNNKKPLPDHVTYQPGLLAQLYRTAVDPDKRLDEVGGSNSNKPSSRPPLAFEAYARWHDIRRMVHGWCESLALPVVSTAEAGIQQLGCLAPQLDSDTLDALVQDAKMWRRWAAVMTGWENKVFVPTMRCPVCTSFRSIRISTTAGTGFCSQCQHYWDSGEDIVCLGQTAQKQAA
jgi:hypothetical protein